MPTQPVPRLLPFSSAKDIVPESDERFGFVVTGESRPPSPRMPFPRATLEIVDEVRLLEPAFAVSTGDAIWGYNDTPQELENEYDRLRALADRAGVPFFNVPGNHEMQTDLAAIETMKRKGHALYGSFDVGRYHFVTLNTDEHWKEGRVCDEQMQWLTADLEQSRGSEGVFVFMHRPVFSWVQGNFNPDDAESLRALFREHPVKAVFASHDHFFNREEQDDVLFFTIGGGGAPLYAQPAQGGFAHYMLVTVGPDGVDYNLVEPGHLEVSYVAGNDGLQAMSKASVRNTTDRDLVARNLGFRVPRTSSPDLYEVSVDYVNWARERVDLQARIRRVSDNGDGSVTLVVEVPMPTGSGFFVTVEVPDPVR